MESFRIVAPSAGLAKFVKQYWILRTGAASERIIPSGNIQLCFYSGASLTGDGGRTWNSQAVLCGQTSGFADLQTLGVIRIISVVFHPYGARTFFTIPMTELCGQKVTAGDLNDAALHELEQKVADTGDDGECIRMIESFFLKRFQWHTEYNYRRVCSTIQLIDQRRGEVRLPELAATACLSGKQFQRVFSEYIGMKPKEFLRVVRFQYALSVLQRSPGMSFSQLAYECGYYDQSHLINEFRCFSGYTPGEYVSVCLPYSDYFS